MMRGVGFYLQPLPFNDPNSFSTFSSLDKGTLIFLFCFFLLVKSSCWRSDSANLAILAFPAWFSWDSIWVYRNSKNELFSVLATPSQRKFASSVQSLRDVTSAVLCNVLFGQRENIIKPHLTEKKTPPQGKRTRKEIEEMAILINWIKARQLDTNVS